MSKDVALLDPKEMVIATAFFCQRSMQEGRPTKPVFNNRSAVFNPYEQLADTVVWAKKIAAEEGKELLKLELTLNSRG